MRVSGVALPWLYVHDRQREISRRDHARVAVLAGTASADEAMLSALVAFDLCVFKGSPIGLLFPEASDISFHDLFDRHAFQLLRPRMPCNAHDALLFANAICSRFS